MRLAANIFIGCLLLALGRAAPAAEFHVRSWRTEHGLPHGYVRDLLQSRDGFLWIGTSAGLARFDGVEFVVFNRARFPEMLSENILALAQTRDGAIWAGAENGLCRLEHGKLTVFKSDPVRSPAAPGGDHIRALHAAQDGALWIATTNGLDRFSGGIFEHFTTEHGLRSNNIRTVGVDSGGGVWAAPEIFWAAGGVDYLAPGKARFESVSPADLGHLTHSMAQDANGNFWWGNNLGAHRLDDSRVDDFSVTNGLSCQVVSRIRPGKSGVFLVTNPRAEFPGDPAVYSIQGNVLQRIPPEYHPPNPTIAIEDEEGAIWVGSRTEGLFQLLRSDARMITPKQGLPLGSIIALAQGPGESVAVAMDSGATMVTSTSVHVLNPQPPEWIETLYLPKARQNFWINPRGVFFVTDRNGAVESADTEKAGFFQRLRPAGRTAAFAAAAADDLIFIAADDRIVLRLAHDRYVTNITGAPLPRGIQAMLCAPGETLWVATPQSLSRFRYSLPDERVHLDPPTLFDTDKAQIRSLVLGSTNRLWAVTDRGIGFVAADRFQLNRSLPAENMFALVEDDFGALWIGSNRGILRGSIDEILTGATNAGFPTDVMALAEGNGVPVGKISAACKDSRGHLWFASSSGLIEINPRRDFMNHVPPKALVEGVKMDGITIVEADAQLPAGRGRTAEFFFTAPSLADPRRNRFRYKLEGVDLDWRDSQGRRQAIYTLLRPGSYTFKVMAWNNHGVPSRRAAAFQFSIAPFFWQTAWFKTALGLGIFLAAFLWHCRRLALARRLHALEQQRQLQSERARIARDMHDDLGAGLARVALMSDLLAREHHGPPVRHLRDAARDLIRSLDEIVWAVHPGKDNSEDLINYIGQFAQEFLSGRDIRLTLDFPPESTEIEIPSRIRHNLLLALKEALHNIVKHSGASAVCICLRFSSGRLRLEISDDGRGLPLESRDGEGDGLANMRERLREIGGDLQIESTATGLRVIAGAPLH